MTDVPRFLGDMATNAYECAKEQVHTHPFLDSAVGIGLAVAGGVAFRGKLGEIWPCAKELFGAGETLATKSAGTEALIPSVPLSETSNLISSSGSSIHEGAQLKTSVTAVTEPAAIPQLRGDLLTGIPTPAKGALSDQNLVSVVNDAQALTKRWWDADGKVGAFAELGDGLPSPFSSRMLEALRQLNSGHIHPEHIGRFDDGITQLSSVADRLPIARELADAAAKLKSALLDVISDSGGESVEVGGNWQSRAQPELVSARLGTLSPNSRFKMLPGSANVFEVDEVGEQVTFHHVDIQTINNQVLPSDAAIFRGAGDTDLLSKMEPLKGFHLGMTKIKPFEHVASKLSNMTKRGLQDYTEKLEIPANELSSSEHRILDIGAGAQQELARDAQKAGLTSRIFSIDPGLALKEEEDLSRINYSMDRSYRLKGRNEAQSMTLAANGEALPFPDHSVDAAYAMFSIPYWAKKESQVGTFLSEIRRVVKPGGFGRVYPIRESQTPLVEQWLTENGLNLQSAIKFKPPNVGRGPLSRYSETDYYLLTMKF